MESIYIAIIVLSLLLCGVLVHKIVQRCRKHKVRIEAFSVKAVAETKPQKEAAALPASAPAPVAQPYTYPSRQHVHTILLKSSYVQYMNDEDRSAHGGLASPEDYIDNFLKTMSTTFAPDEDKQLRELVTSIDAATKSYPRLYEIPWKIAKVHPKTEWGAPFTMGDTIFLSEDFFKEASQQNKWRTLVHEKLHVFQRRYPHEVGLLYRDRWGFTFNVGIRNLHKDIPLRGNPDIDGLIYGKSQYMIAQRYTTEKPQSIYDSEPVKIRISDGKVSKLTHDDLGMPKWVGQIEHPNEIMAGVLSMLVWMETQGEEVRKKAGDIFYSHPVVTSTMAWAEMYL